MGQARTCSAAATGSACVIGAERFTAALREAITDPAVRRLPPTGAVDQFIDSTDALGDLGFLRACAGAA